MAASSRPGLAEWLTDKPTRARDEMRAPGLITPVSRRPLQEGDHLNRIEQPGARQIPAMGQAMRDKLVQRSRRLALRLGPATGDQLERPAIVQEQLDDPGLLDRAVSRLALKPPPRHRPTDLSSSQTPCD